MYSSLYMARLMTLMTTGTGWTEWRVTDGQKITYAVVRNGNDCDHGIRSTDHICIALASYKAEYVLWMHQVSANHQ